MDTLFTRTEPVIPIRGVHLDLKGVPPTFERLLELLKVFAACRYNAVLVEWEDQFPWRVDQAFRGPTCYTLDQVRQFHAAAAEAGLEIIPLVQCLGHLEWVLSPPGREHLLEVPGKTDVLNPLAPGARELIESLVNDVLKLSPNLKHFHLGGDEAWTFGTHPDTKAYIEKHGKGQLYLKHVGPILEMLNEKGIRPILWHDMMSEWDDQALRDINRHADLMFWWYADHPDKVSSHHHFSPTSRKRFHAQGITLWGASAYKGADGQSADLPNIEARQRNNLGWAEVAQRENLKGVVATGWSRYSHHRVQNEPIDGSLDSLLNVGVILHDGKAPEGGIDACLSALANLPEAKCFAACHAALKKLQEARAWVWRNVQEREESLWLEEHRPERRGTTCSGVSLEHILGNLEKAETAAVEIRDVFKQLLPSVWIEEYLEERIEPMRRIRERLQDKQKIRERE
ncbi:MAG: family 20 glycosylhydrolase [Phycisphaerae bacterium]|nr:family 20 glycosylhydrolase [Phycisphaerae bacterium]